MSTKTTMKSNVNVASKVNATSETTKGKETMKAQKKYPAKTDVMTASRIIAMSCLKVVNDKTTSDKVAYDLFRPSTFNPLFEELQAIASLAICETHDNDVVITRKNGTTLTFPKWGRDNDNYIITRSRFTKATALAKKRIYQYIYLEKKADFKSLYSIDADGASVSNVTLDIERAQFELMDILKRGMRPTYYNILKSVMKGHTTETMMRRYGYTSKRGALEAKRRAIANAREVLKANGYNVDILRQYRDKITEEDVAVGKFLAKCVKRVPFIEHEKVKRVRYIVPRKALTHVEKVAMIDKAREEQRHGASMARVPRTRKHDASAKRMVISKAESNRMWMESIKADIRQK